MEKFEDLKGHRHFDAPLASITGVSCLNEFVFFFYSSQEVHAYHRVDRYWEEDIACLPYAESIAVCGVGGKWLVSLSWETASRLRVCKLNVQDFLYGEWIEASISRPFGLYKRDGSKRELQLIPFHPKVGENAIAIVSMSYIDQGTVWDLETEEPQELPWSFNQVTKSLPDIEATELAIYCNTIYLPHHGLLATIRSDLI